jgi:hypothetical protein
MFKLYVQFLSDAGLLGKTAIGIDGSKFKAVNSKKNNYNQKKIDKHRQFIEDKTAKYLQQLDELDQQENKTARDELQLKKEKITLGLAKLKNAPSNTTHFSNNWILQQTNRSAPTTRITAASSL